MVSVDNAVVAPGQTSTETGVTVAMQDSAARFDYHLTRRLLRLADELGLEANRDVFTHYRSDIAAALEAGAEMRAALLGFGVDASHGHERTHLDAIRGVAELLAAYVQTRSRSRPTRRHAGLSSSSRSRSRWSTESSEGIAQRERGSQRAVSARRTRAAAHTTTRSPRAC